MTTICLERPEDYADDLDDLALKLRNEPRNAEVRFQHALALLAHDRRQEALNELARAIELQPQYGDAIYWHGRISELSNLEQRMEQLRTDSTAGRPVDPQAWVVCHEVMLDHDSRAATDLLEEYLRDHAHKVASDHPDATAPLRNLAYSLAQTLQPEDLRRAYEVAARATTHCQRTLDDFAVHAIVAEAAGKPQEARNAAEEGLRFLRPSDAKSDSGDTLRLGSFRRLLEGVMERTNRP